MLLTDAELAQVIVDLKYLPPEKVAEASTKAKHDGISLYDCLVQRDYISEEDLGKVLAYHYDLPYIALQNTNIPEALLQLLPATVAEQFMTVPFELQDDNLHIATARPEAADLFMMLAKKAGAKSYQVSYATETGIRSALSLYKQHLQDVFGTMLLGGPASSQPIAKIINKLFEYAADNHASDIHIEPGVDATLVRFRIDGVLYDEVSFPKAIHEQVVTRIKVLARLRTDEHQSAQDGRLQLILGEEELTARVSIVPVMTGEKVVMRLLTKQAHQLSLTELGMTDNDLSTVRQGFIRPFGMILSTGPTGSGKTTTMYAILKILNTRDRNIATIEDPVEYQIEGINQIQVNTKTNLTFSAGLRSLLRQDPDILFVGEIRDEETASIAVNAAMTGHLVLSTMHTNDAATTLPRLADMDVEPFLTASTVNIIVSQRLVRKICEHCKASLELTKTTSGWHGDEGQVALLDSLDIKLVNAHFGKKSSIRTYHGVGCSACRGTGYQGRLGIFEVLQVTPTLAKLITAKADTDALLKQAIKDGMTTLMDDGLDKVIAGQTTLSEIVRVTSG